MGIPHLRSQTAPQLLAVAPPAGRGRRGAASTRGPSKSVASSVIGRKSLIEESFRTDEEKHAKFSFLSTLCTNYLDWEVFGLT